MKERFIVASEAPELPEFTDVTWFEKKSDAIIEAQRRKEVYWQEKTYLLKVLNIPSKNSKPMKDE